MSNSLAQWFRDVNNGSTSSWRGDTSQMNNAGTSRQGSSYPHSQAWNPSTASSSSSNYQQQQQRQPNPPVESGSRTYSSGVVNNGRPVPVPSEEQVNDYLITHMAQPEGLYTGWTIQGSQFSVYSLFTTVVQMGGSSLITQQDQWMYVAQALKFPGGNLPSAQRSRAYQRIGVELREFFLRMLGGLEILWERTKAADEAERQRTHTQASSYTNSEAARRAELSLTQSPNQNNRTSWATQPTRLIGDNRQSGMPTPSTDRSTGQQNNTTSTIYTQKRVPQSYSGIRPTPSPSNDQRQHSPPPNLAGYHNPPQTSSRRMAPQSNTIASSAPPARQNEVASQRTAPSTSSNNTRAVDWDPPLVSSLETLVDHQVLELPPHASSLTVPNLGSRYLEYAWRVHELRSSIRKMSSGESRRSLLPEEIVWWNRLVLLLQKNPKLVIPVPSSTTFPAPINETYNQSPQEPSRPTTINPTSIQNLVQPVHSASQPSLLSYEATSSRAGPSSVTIEPGTTKKKRGRPSKASQMPVQPAATGESLDGLSGANTAQVPVKKKRVRKPKEHDPNDPMPKKRQKKSTNAEASAADPLSVPAVVDATPSSSKLAVPLSASLAIPSVAIQPNTTTGAVPVSGVSTATTPLTTSVATSSRPVPSAGPAEINTASGKKAVARTRKNRSIQPANASGFQPSSSQQSNQPQSGSSQPSQDRIGPPSQVTASGSIPAGTESAADYLRSIYQKENIPYKDALRPELYPPLPPSRPSATPYSIPSIGQASQSVNSHANEILELGPDGRPTPEAIARARSMATKAAWERYRLHGGAPLGRQKMPVVVNSASPIRVLHLSGSRISQAQLTLRDIETPTKVLTRMKRPRKRSRLSQGVSGSPNTLAEALAGSEVGEDEDDMFDPFMELSQTFMATSPPPKKLDAFVAYAPARIPAPKQEEVAMPDEVDVLALAAAIDADTQYTAGDMDIEVIADLDAEGEDEIDINDIQMRTPTTKKGKGKGKGKKLEIVLDSRMGQGKGKGKAVAPQSRSVEAEPAPALIAVRSPGGKKGKLLKLTPKSVSSPALPKPAPTRQLEVDIPVLPRASGSLATEDPSILLPRLKKIKTGKKLSTPGKRTPSPPAPRITRSFIPSPPRPAPKAGPSRKAIARRPAPKKIALRSLGGPPSASLRDRPKQPLLLRNGKMKHSRPAKRTARSPSIVVMLAPPRRTGTASRVRPVRENIRKTGPAFIPGSIDRAVVSIPITDGRRRRLILLGRYNAFRDDDSDEEELGRGGVRSLRPIKPLPGMKSARSIRAREPEIIPDRFAHSYGPALLEPWRSLLIKDILIRVAVEHKCRWKGCDAILGSEEFLQKHVDFNQHTALASFKTGPNNAQTLWKCHWQSCEGPCFENRLYLDQHISARHVSRILACPYQGCELTSPNISHLGRHVTKHENDTVRPLADLSTKLPPAHAIPDQIIPEIARTDELTTNAVSGKTYSNQFRREWAIHKVKTGCFAGENPVMHVEHPPHMLGVSDDADESGIEEESDDDERYYDAQEVTQEKLLDQAAGKRRRWVPVVCIPRKQWPAKVIVIEDTPDPEGHDTAIQATGPTTGVTSQGDIAAVHVDHSVSNDQATVGAIEKPDDANLDGLQKDAMISSDAALTGLDVYASDGDSDDDMEQTLRQALAENSDDEAEAATETVDQTCDTGPNESTDANTPLAEDTAPMTEAVDYAMGAIASPQPRQEQPIGEISPAEPVNLASSDKHAFDLERDVTMRDEAVESVKAKTVEMYVDEETQLPVEASTGGTENAVEAADGVTAEEASLAAVITTTETALEGDNLPDEAPEVSTAVTPDLGAEEALTSEPTEGETAREAAGNHDIADPDDKSVGADVVESDFVGGAAKDQVEPVVRDAATDVTAAHDTSLMELVPEDDPAEDDPAENGVPGDSVAGNMVPIEAPVDDKNAFISAADEAKYDEMTKAGIAAGIAVGPSAINPDCMFGQTVVIDVGEALDFMDSTEFQNGVNAPDSDAEDVDDVTFVEKVKQAISGADQTTESGPAVIAHTDEIRDDQSQSSKELGKSSNIEDSNLVEDHGRAEEDLATASRNIDENPDDSDSFSKEMFEQAVKYISGESVETDAGAVTSVTGEIGNDPVDGSEVNITAPVEGGESGESAGVEGNGDVRAGDRDDDDSVDNVTL